ncbi:replication protein A 70 kDa DNA-binding subunit-like [Homarus americanus]|uniref:replication protein A 70 kDa DNA-binding subunit-like n=1 Tax=Homarus americanus TaxID=6706 RepID=UPI001C445AA9|nr:replication protein A 70 kDa DNA-binding subunit-like [Homarus americanus]
MKRIPTGSQERYRLLVSDGEWSSSFAMLATHLNCKVTEGVITNNCIIQMNRYVCNTVQGNKKVLIILEMKLERTGEEVGLKLGDPVNYDPNKSRPQQQPMQQQRSQPHLPTPSMGAIGGTPQRNPLGEHNPLKQGISPSKTPTGGNVHPICSLTPYQNKWTVCVRVNNKTDIRTWSNSRGEGKLFSMDLIDESGEIRATAFNEQVDKFHDTIELNKVYFISSATLKPANKQYCNLMNDYEMTFNKMTEVTPCHEVTSIPTMQFNFVPIDQLESLNKDTLIDIIGVCKEAHDISTVIQKTSGRELKKRDMQLLDETQREVRLTLWGSQAENFDGSQQPIVAVKGAKLSDFNGRCLSTIASSAVQINPDIREAHKLKGWFDNGGCNIGTVNLSNQRSGFGGANDTFKTFGEAMAEKLGSIESDFYKNKAYITLIRHDNSVYAACPSDNCNKKVIDLNNGMYRCEKCGREYDTFQWRLMLQMNLMDCTNTVWATAFHDIAEEILGTTAENIGNLKETDHDAFTKFFINATFKEYVFNLRVKMESYNDEGRLKTSVNGCKPLDLKEYNKLLIDEIEKLSGVSKGEC